MTNTIEGLVSEIFSGDDFSDEFKVKAGEAISTMISEAVERREKEILEEACAKKAKDDADMEAASKEADEKKEKDMKESIDARVEEIRAQLQSEFDTKLSEEVEKLQESTKAYLENAKQDFLEKNKVEIVSQAKLTLAENIIAAMGNIMVDYGAILSDDIVAENLETMKKENDSLVMKVARLSEALDIERKMSDLSEMKRDEVRSMLNEGKTVDIDAIVADEKQKTKALSFITEGVVIEKDSHEKVKEKRVSDPAISAILESLNKAR